MAKILKKAKFGRLGIRTRRTLYLARNAVSLWRLGHKGRALRDAFISVDRAQITGLRTLDAYVNALPADKAAALFAASNRVRLDRSYPENIRLFAHTLAAVAAFRGGQWALLIQLIQASSNLVLRGSKAETAMANVLRDLSLVLPMPVQLRAELLSSDWKRDAPPRASVARTLGVAIDGDLPDAEAFALLLAKYYPSLKSASVVFFKAPSEAAAVKRFARRLEKHKIEVEFPDLLTEFTPADSPVIHSIAGGAYVAAEQAMAAIIDGVEGLARDHLVLFHEPLTLAMEDRYFRYLRLLQAADLFCNDGDFEEVLVVSSSGMFLPALISVAQMHYGARAVRVSTLGAAPASLQRCLRAVKAAGKASGKGDEWADAENHLARFRPPRTFYSAAFGPVRPKPEVGARLPAVATEGYGARLDQMYDAFPRLRSVYQQLSPPEASELLADCPVREYGNPAVAPEEPWLCLIINLDERVYGPLYVELLRHYLPRRKLLIIDHGREGSDAWQLAERDLMPSARCCRVYNFLALARTAKLPKHHIDHGPRGDYRAAHARIWGVMDLLGEREPLVEVMAHADSRAKGDLDHHLKVGASTLVLFRAHHVQALLGFPTRNTHMRMAVQAGRLLGVPSVEVQSLLGGRMVRHRGPNTDHCALLESWSRDSFDKAFGYPPEHVHLLGSLRFERMMADAKSEEACADIAGMRQRLFPDAATPFRLVLFGTQPLDTERTVHCLRLVVEACAALPDTRLIVKPHPAEHVSRDAIYADLVGAVMPPERAMVLRDIDVTRLAAAADVVVSQFSNLLLEAACLGRRACSLNFTGAPPPIDFAEMGVAVEVRAPAAVPDIIAALVATPEGQHPLDLSRRTFLAANEQLTTCGYVDRLTGIVDDLVSVAYPGDETAFEDRKRLPGFAHGMPDLTPEPRRTGLARQGEGEWQVDNLNDLVAAFRIGHGATPARFAGFLSSLTDDAVERLQLELDDALGGEAAPNRIIHLILATYLALRQCDVPRAINQAHDLDDIVAGGAAVPRRQSRHLAGLLALLPHRITEIRKRLKHGLGAADVTAPRTHVRHVLLLSEGDIDPDVAMGYVDRVFPAAEAVTVSFLNRPNNVVDRFQNELLPRTDRTYSFIDMLADYTGNYMPTINSCVGSSYVLGDAITERLLDDHSGPIRHMMGFLREPLSQGIEDHYYRYLRTLKSMKVLLEANPADALLLVAATGGNLQSVIAASQRHFADDDIYVAMPTQRVAQLTHLIESLHVVVSRPVESREPIPPTRLSDFRPPPPFCSYVHGPIRPALDPESLLPRPGAEAFRDRYDAMGRDADALRSYLSSLPDAALRAMLAQIPAIRYGDASTGEGDWVLLAINLDDRVHAKLYEDLIAHYRRNSRLLILDFSVPDGAAFAGVAKRLFADALCVEVYRYRDIVKRLAPPTELQVPTTGPGFADLHPVVHRDAGIDISLQDLAVVLTPADHRVHHGVLPSHFAVAIALMALLRLHPVTKAVICPTRSSYMRIAAQTVRLFKVPTLEAQTVLNGRMVRHRAPNTDYCSVLEIWSRDYYATFFGYPMERLLLGGALRYDLIVDGVENDTARAAIAGLRESLFPGSGQSPLVVFGTQPMQISDNLFCIERLLDACSAVPDTRVVIKVHPAESDSNSRTYERVGLKHFPADRLVVTKDVDTYHLMKAANLTVSQTSNILLEAGFLDCRAISLHFGAYHPPVDFEEMNAAMIIKEPAKLPGVIRELLTAAPGTHWFDARRRRFIEENQQLVDRRYRDRIVGFLDRLDGWQSGYEAMVAADEARLASFDPAAYGWRL